MRSPLLLPDMDQISNSDESELLHRVRQLRIQQEAIAKQQKKQLKELREQVLTGPPVDSGATDTLSLHHSSFHESHGSWEQVQLQQYLESDSVKREIQSLKEQQWQLKQLQEQTLAAIQRQAPSAHAAPNEREVLGDRRQFATPEDTTWGDESAPKAAPAGGDGRPAFHHGTPPQFKRRLRDRRAHTGGACPPQEYSAATPPADAPVFADGPAYPSTPGRPAPPAHPPPSGAVLAPTSGHRAAGIAAPEPGPLRGTPGNRYLQEALSLLDGAPAADQPPRPLDEPPRRRSRSRSGLKAKPRGGSRRPASLGSPLPSHDHRAASRRPSGFSDGGHLTMSKALRLLDAVGADDDAGESVEREAPFASDPPQRAERGRRLDCIEPAHDPIETFPSVAIPWEEGFEDGGRPVVGVKLLAQDPSRSPARAAFVDPGRPLTRRQLRRLGLPRSAVTSREPALPQTHPRALTHERVYEDAEAGRMTLVSRRRDAPPYTVQQTQGGRWR
ncbi:hypothetical protein DIPPA_08817 [Diplonema papillatum]|nr:hypothetical protein DIPPA_08817 [Diplonema papillatum]